MIPRGGEKGKRTLSDIETSAADAAHDKERRELARTARLLLKERPFTLERVRYLIQSGARIAFAQRMLADGTASKNGPPYQIQINSSLWEHRRALVMWHELVHIHFLHLNFLGGGFVLAPDPFESLIDRTALEAMRTPLLYPDELLALLLDNELAKLPSEKVREACDNFVHSTVSQVLSATPPSSAFLKSQSQRLKIVKTTDTVHSIEDIRAGNVRLYLPAWYSLQEQIHARLEASVRSYLRHRLRKTQTPIMDLSRPCAADQIRSWAKNHVLSL
jgi:hypothetical protein